MLKFSVTEPDGTKTDINGTYHTLSFAETLAEIDPFQRQPIVIKGHSGGPEGKWDEVQAIQHEPFIYISYCGNSEENGIEELLNMLAHYRLAERDRGRDCYTVNPCHWADNPKWDRWDSTNGEEQWIDGPRMYACDGVVRFSGNFERYAFAFGIDTNHKPTIDALMAAIELNSKLTA